MADHPNYMLPSPTPTPGPTSPKEGAELLRKLRIALAKTRSVSIETSGAYLTEFLTPEVMPGSLLNGALELSEGRTPTWNTLNNILFLARNPLITMGYALHWGEDLPEGRSFPYYQGGDA